ncbi:T9SS type A sorting domain-containing protein [bacterium]|nr:T9SS type A sorting domain-containing protein [bacterium]
MKRLVLLAGLLLLVASTGFAWTEAQLNQIEEAAIAANPTPEQVQLLQQYMDWRDAQTMPVTPYVPGNSVDDLEEFWDFEGSGDPFVPEAAEWEWGEPLPSSDTAHPGPGSAYSGTNAWATGLARPHGATAGDEWLWTSEPFNIQDDEAYFTYWHWYDYFYWEGYNVWASIDGGATWELLYPDAGYPDMQGFDGFLDQVGFNNRNGVHDYWGQETFQIGQYDGEEVMIGFRHWATSVVEYYGVCFDDFELFGTAPAGPVDLDLTGTVTTIPPSGGIVYYDAHLINITGQTFANVRFWTEVTLPNNQVFGPLTQIPFTIQPFMDVTVQALTQEIPDIAPSGTYTFTGYVGRTQGPYIDDDFTFEKTGVAAGDYHTWEGSTFTIEDLMYGTASVPNTYALQDAWPNPFNAATNVSVVLPESADLSVAVFNTLGQKVAELANSKFSAGTHTFTFDGSNLASGIYFVNAQVPGQLNAMQKITMIK